MLYSAVHRSRWERMDVLLLSMCKGFGGGSLLVSQLSLPKRWFLALSGIFQSSLCSELTLKIGMQHALGWKVCTVLGGGKNLWQHMQILTEQAQRQEPSCILATLHKKKTQGTDSYILTCPKIAITRSKDLGAFFTTSFVFWRGVSLNVNGWRKPEWLQSLVEIFKEKKPV